MDAAIIGFILCNVVLYAGLGVACLRILARDRSPRVRWLAATLGFTCGAFLLGALQRLALQAARLGVISPEVTAGLLHEWQLAKSVGALTLGLAAMWTARRALTGIRDADRLVQVLTPHVPMKAAVSELGLTPRELEVLDILGSGALSDAQIAAELQISPHTAHTHVRNIMSKAAVRSRRDLLLLVHDDDAS